MSATPNDIWIDADQELREPLQTRLERYVIADDVMIEDVTDQFALFHVLADSEQKISGAKFCFRSWRLGIDGWDLWVEVARAEAVKSTLAADYRAMDESEWEILRIENGIPRWGRELTPEIIPPEANLQMRAIDYEKGCYTGQEVISRMKMSGQTNKRLCGLVSKTGAPLANGMRLTPVSEENKDVGWISSAVRSETLGKFIALGFVKRGFNQVGALLSARPAESTKDMEGIRVEIIALPFV